LILKRFNSTGFYAHQPAHHFNYSLIRENLNNLFLPYLKVATKDHH
jgi:hypothetical protein